MTTPTPTGDHMSGAPSWLPDEATLTRWANELFAALPATPTLPPPAPASGSPTGPAPDLRRTPVAAPPATVVPRLAATEAGLPLPPASQPPAPWSAAQPLATPQFYFVDQLNLAAQSPALPLDLHPPFNVEAIRRDFPILAERINGRRLVWLDNAATTQKPQAVIDRLATFYTHENSNIHRAAHTLAARSTDAYEAARCTVAEFLGAPSPETIVFTRGTTEAINLVAQAWGRQHVGAENSAVECPIW